MKKLRGGGKAEIGLYTFFAAFLIYSTVPLENMYIKFSSVITLQNTALTIVEKLIYLKFCDFVFRLEEFYRTCDYDFRSRGFERDTAASRIWVLASRRWGPGRRQGYQPAP
jgi:hypothetical protein